MSTRWKTNPPKYKIVRTGSSSRSFILTPIRWLLYSPDPSDFHLFWLLEHFIGCRGGGELSETKRKLKIVLKFLQEKKGFLWMEHQNVIFRWSAVVKNMVIIFLIKIIRIIAPYIYFYILCGKMQLLCEHFNSIFYFQEYSFLPLNEVSLTSPNTTQLCA